MLRAVVDERREDFVRERDRADKLMVELLKARLAPSPERSDRVVTARRPDGHGLVLDVGETTTRALPSLPRCRCNSRRFASARAASGEHFKRSASSA